MHYLCGFGFESGMDIDGDLRVDMAKLLQEQQKRPMDFVWVAYYFKQVIALQSSAGI